MRFTTTAISLNRTGPWQLADHWCFFDDHQNAYKRLQQCKWFGFRHVVFEDNYPSGQGDSYSLKQAFANAGFDPARSQQISAIGNLRKFAGHLGQRLLGLNPPT